MLDFVRPDDSRVENGFNLTIWDMGSHGGPVQLSPTGSTPNKDSDIQLYHIHSTGRYEIRQLDGRVIAMISFPRTVHIEHPRI